MEGTDVQTNLITLKMAQRPPCRAACPADVNVQGYVALIQQGKFKESVELIRKNMPFPAICGRICVSPCQDACTRKEVDQPVGVRYLKRLAADIEREQGRLRPKSIPKRHFTKVAIIGAGPAGLTAAFELVKRGYPATIFERMPEPGGMMRYCIPDYRLQKYVVANEIAYLQDLGVEIKTQIEFGRDVSLETLQNEGYRAVFLAIGAQLSRKLGIRGEELNGVFCAIEFLRDVALGKIFDLGERVAVIGGGNSAVDAARTSLKLGAKKALILYRRSRKEMPALPYEVEAARKEGVKIHFLVSPKQIIGKCGKVKAIECFRMKLGEPDASGRRRPESIPGSEHLYEVDTVIPAIGQVAETSHLPSKVVDKHKGLVAVDPLTLETNVAGVFSGGDVVTGPASVIEAVGAGRRAAESIDRYLSGKEMREGRDGEVKETTWVKDAGKITKKSERYVSVHIDVGRWEASFEEADELLVRSKETAIFEARRCLGCGPCKACLGSEKLCECNQAVIDESLCLGCNVCTIVCPYGAVNKNDEGIAVVDANLCKGCGICSANCPKQAITTKKFPEAQVLGNIETALWRKAA